MWGSRQSDHQSQLQVPCEHQKCTPRAKETQRLHLRRAAPLLPLAVVWHRSVSIPPSAKRSMPVRSARIPIRRAFHTFSCHPRLHAAKPSKCSAVSHICFPAAAPSPMALSWSRPASAVLLALYCLHCTACAVLLPLSCLRCPACTVLLALYCLRCPACTVLLALYCLHCTACAVLFALYCLQSYSPMLDQVQRTACTNALMHLSALILMH